MGFINWDGERDNSKERYQEAKDYAEMIEADERSAAFNKKIERFSLICGTPEMSGLNREKIIKILILDFSEIKDVYDNLLLSKKFKWNYDMNLIFRDLWLYILYSIIYGKNSDNQDPKLSKIFDVFSEKIFRVEGQITRIQFFDNMANNAYYKRYMMQSYGFTKHDPIYFWRWIGYLSKDIPIDNVAKDFADDFYRLVARSIYFINILLNRFDLGMEYIFNKNDYLRNTYMQLTYKSKLDEIIRYLINPVYSSNEEYKKAVEYKKIKESQMNAWKERYNSDKRGRSYEGTDFEQEVNSKIIFDREKIKPYIEKRTLESFAEVFNIISRYPIPEKMKEVTSAINEELIILQHTIKKFGEVYNADIEQFYDYYIPETIELIISCIEYKGAKVNDKIVAESINEVLDASDSLLFAIVDKKNEIYKFGLMELKARAKALESLMGQDGHVPKGSRIE